MAAASAIQSRQMQAAKRPLTPVAPVRERTVTGCARCTSFAAVVAVKLRHASRAQALARQAGRSASHLPAAPRA